MKCLNCNSDFESLDNKRKFCSCSCSNSYNNKIRYKKNSLNEGDTKICKICKEEKNISEFYKRSGSVDGFRNDCKKCLNIRTINQKNRKNTKKKYYDNNKEIVKEKVKEYYKNNKEKIKDRAKKYAKENKDARNIYLKNKYDNDALFKISVNARSAISKAFKRNGFDKKSKTYEILGCSFEELKSHIETQFKEGMSWSNYGSWHVDHKTPLSWNENEQHLRELCHFSNLQPLWSFDNLSKRNFYAG